MVKEVKNIIHAILPQQDAWKLTLLQKWKEIIGDLEPYVWIEKMYKDAIQLGVIDSGWLQELYLLTPVLLDTINAKLDAPRIKKIMFKNKGERKTGTTLSLPKIPVQTTYIPQSVMLSDEELDTLNCIKDRELRTALQAFLIRCHQRKQQ